MNGTNGTGQRDKRDGTTGQTRWTLTGRVQGAKMAPLKICPVVPSRRFNYYLKDRLA